MGIHISGNLYRQQPHRDLWEKGWRLERKKEDMKRAPGKRPIVDESVRIQEKDRPRPRPHERKHKQPRRPEPVINDRLIARFNRRNRTSA